MHWRFDSYIVDSCDTINRCTGESLHPYCNQNKIHIYCNLWITFSLTGLWALGRQFLKCNFQTHFMNWHVEQLQWNWCYVSAVMLCDYFLCDFCLGWGGYYPWNRFICLLKHPVHYFLFKIIMNIHSILIISLRNIPVDILTFGCTVPWEHVIHKCRHSGNIPHLMATQSCAQQMVDITGQVYYMLSHKALLGWHSPQISRMHSWDI